MTLIQHLTGGKKVEYAATEYPISYMKNHSRHSTNKTPNLCFRYLHYNITMNTRIPTHLFPQGIIIRESNRRNTT